MQIGPVLERSHEMDPIKMVILFFASLGGFFILFVYDFVLLIWSKEPITGFEVAGKLAQLVGALLLVHFADRLGYFEILFDFVYPFK